MTVSASLLSLAWEQRLSIGPVAVQIQVSGTYALKIGEGFVQDVVVQRHLLLLVLLNGVVYNLMVGEVG
jgi:hypothetical protein